MIEESSQVIDVVPEAVGKILGLIRKAAAQMIGGDDPVLRSERLQQRAPVVAPGGVSVDEDERISRALVDIVHAPARLARLVGRGRALEILIGGEDFDGELAERYGYVNRALPDAELDAFVTAFATRVSRFDRTSLVELKGWVDEVTLPEDAEFVPQGNAFGAALARPAFQAWVRKAFESGLQQPGDFEANLGARSAAL